MRILRQDTKRCGKGSDKRGDQAFNQTIGIVYRVKDEAGIFRPVASRADAPGIEKGRGATIRLGSDNAAAETK